MNFMESCAMSMVTKKKGEKKGKKTRSVEGVSYDLLPARAQEFHPSLPPLVERVEKYREV